MDEMDEKCATCRFWLAVRQVYDGNAEVFGVCRRYPPGGLSTYVLQMLALGRAAELTPVSEAHWPNTSEEDWCGEYSPRSPATD